MGEEKRPASVFLPALADPDSAMIPRFNLFFRWFARRFFGHFDLDERTVARLRELESRGSVVYVMRYASRLDYFLFNTLFLREGLRLSGFAHGLRFYYYGPLLAALPRFFRRRFMGSGARRERDLEQAREHVRDLVLAGQSLFLFLRTARFSWLRGRRALAQEGKEELDLLGEIVRTVWAEQRSVQLVPLAIFWRKGPRAERRFLNLAYGGPTRPSDLAKVSSFLTTYRDLMVKAGDPIDLGSFIGERRHEGPDSIVRKVRRSIMIFLYREERVVEGPTLRPTHKVQEIVLGDPDVRAATLAWGRLKRKSPEVARREAEKMFREIAAAMNSTFLAVLNAIVSWIFGRMFASIEVNGIEKIAEYAKQHPLVLVPSHRSYFDFLILSWLFYRNYLVPPHIAARENMGFGPFGFIFRRAGAFFLRRSFDDPLYKEVFRRYIAYLVEEGFTQEFFIEGGRSRTGKTLVPRLGMLSWDVEAFLASGRRDLFLVPIGITYERLVEEGAMIEELEGAKKKEESVLGLVRARKYLQRRFGSVFVNFGEPISLAEALGPRRSRLAGESDEAALVEKRRFVEELGNRLVERINFAMVANATSLAACVLLGEARRGLFRFELTQRMREVLELLRLQDVRITPALLRDQGEFREAIAFLRRSDLVESVQDPRGEILYFEESHRRALDVYRNVLLHYLVAPSFLARRLLRGATVAELRDDLAFWLDLFYPEFFVSKGLVLAAQFDAFLDYFERCGALERREERLLATEKGRGYFAFLAEQSRSVIEAYTAVSSAAQALAGPITAKQLQREVGEHHRRGMLLGEIRRPEGANPVTFGNALDLLVRREILVRTERGPAGREQSYAPGPAFERLAALRERLAAALASR
jgi:glycerol-3-phosphate O-acyltransferase